MTDEQVTNGTAALARLPESHAVRRTGGEYSTAMAVQRPRPSLGEIQRKLDEEARLGGERFYYSWGAAGNKIEGPSIKLANAALRCYGNCAVDLRDVQDMPDSWVFTAIFIDLETGVTLPRQFRMSKLFPVHGKHDQHRKDDMRFQIGQSKVIRNCILNAVPQGLIDSAMTAAKEGVRKKIESFIAQEDKKKPGNGIVAATDYAFSLLAKHGVKEEAILAKLAIAKKSAVTIDHLVILKGDYQAIEDGEVRAEESFPTPEPQGSAAERLKSKAVREREPGEDDYDPDPEKDEHK